MRPPPFPALAAAIALSLLAACTGHAPTAKQSARPSTRPKPHTSPTPRPTVQTTVLAIAGLGDQVRLLVTACAPTCQDVLLSSTDGGQSFLQPRPLPGPPTTYTGMALGPGRVVYVWQSGKQPVLVSRDDGVTWRSSGPVQVRDLQVVRSSSWAVLTACSKTCADVLVGGATGTSPSSWKPLFPANPSIAVHHVSLATAFALRRVGHGTQLLVTRDGGRHWAGRPAPCPAGSRSTVSAVGAAVVWLVCAGATRAGTQDKRSFVSTDAGGHWRAGNLGLAGYANQVHAVSGTRAYATGQRSAVLVTTDGGAHWSADTDVEPAFSRLVQLSDGTLLAGVPSEAGEGSGGNGSVWRRPKGGTWTLRVIARAG